MNLEELVLPMRADTNAFSGAVKGATALVGAAVAAVGVAVKATFDWANELDSLQDIMGVSNRTAAALNFTLRKSGTETGALAQGMTILNKGLVDANGKLDATGKALQKWGIDAMDANGMLKDQTVLLGEVADKYSSFATQQEKVNFLTEVFGKSGAGLVDFFDTLAAEGGIDTVTKKVEALGLAIDPNRYEQFNRSLEELKLIGLALAVGFTESVMPSLEKFLGFITDFAANPDMGKAIKDIDEFAGNIIQGLADSINEWVDSDGPQELTDSIISWVENIGTGGESESKFLTAAGNLVMGLATAIGNIDWISITDSIDNKLAESVTAGDWTSAGDSFGQTLAAVFSTKLPEGMKSQESAAIPAIGNAISDWLLGAMNMTRWSDVGVRISTGLSGSVLYALPGIQSSGLSAGNQIILSTVAGFIQSQPIFTAALSTLQTLSGDKLREVAKVFYSRALAWTQQMKNGFTDGVGDLLSAISGMVGDINKVLAKIKTAFQLSFSWSSIIGGTPPPIPSTGGSTGTVGGGNRPGRASGGPTIAGKSYNVGEYGPEIFTPSVNGRIDANTNNSPQPVYITNIADLIDYPRLAAEIVKAENNN